MSRDWILYLEDIAECASRILRYTRGLDPDSFATNELVIDAVVRNLEIIGDVVTTKVPEIAAASERLLRRLGGRPE